MSDKPLLRRRVIQEFFEARCEIDVVLERTDASRDLAKKAIASERRRRAYALHEQGVPVDRIAVAIRLNVPKTRSILAGRKRTQPSSDELAERKMASFEADPQKWIDHDCHMSEALAWRYLSERLLARADATPKGALQPSAKARKFFELRSARAGPRGRARFRCLAIQAAGIEAACLRALDRASDAIDLLETRLNWGQSCWKCVADLKRRLAYAYLHVGDAERAFGSAVEAGEHYASHNWEHGHDLDKLPNASVQNALSVVHFHSGRPAEAAEAAQAGLDSIPVPDQAPGLSLSLLNYLALGLGLQPDPDLATARRHLDEMLRLADEGSVVRGCTAWTLGIFDYLEGQAERGAFNLDEAADIFRQEEMPAELIAVAMDHARCKAAARKGGDPLDANELGKLVARTVAEGSIENAGGFQRTILPSFLRHEWKRVEALFELIRAKASSETIWRRLEEIRRVSDGSYVMPMFPLEFAT